MLGHRQSGYHASSDGCSDSWDRLCSWQMRTDLRTHHVLDGWMDRGSLDFAMFDVCRMSSWPHKDRWRKWRTDRGALVDQVSCTEGPVSGGPAAMFDGCNMFPPWLQTLMTGESSSIYSHGKAVSHPTSTDVNSKKPPFRLWHLSITPLSTATTTTTWPRFNISPLSVQAWKATSWKEQCIMRIHIDRDILYSITPQYSAICPSPVAPPSRHLNLCLLGCRIACCMHLNACCALWLDSNSKFYALVCCRGHSAWLCFAIRWCN